MATSLTVRRILVQVQGNYANTSDNQTANTDFSFDYTDTLADGTSEDQADLLWEDERTVAQGADDDIDLDGSLTDIYGNSADFAEIRGFMIENLATPSGDNLQIGGGGATEWTSWVGAAGDYVQLHPKGVFALTAPGDGDLTIGAGATDILRVTNGSAMNAIDYKIYVWGTTA